MKFLSKISEIVGKIVVHWTGLAPVVQGFIKDDSGKIQTITDTLLEVRDAVISTEIFASTITSDVSGEDKMRASGAQVAQIILKSSLVANQKIENEELFKTGCERIAGGMADVLNSFKDDIDTENHG